MRAIKQRKAEHMKKTTLLVLMMILAVLVFAACGQPASGGNTVGAEETKTVSTQETLVTSLLNNPVVVSEESLEALIGNNGEFISVEADRETTDDGIQFKAGADENPFMAFTKSQAGTTGNQAFYVQCLPSAVNFGVMMIGESGVGFTVNVDSKPCFFLQNGGYVEQIDTDMVIEPGNWYHILLAVDTTGAFQGVICKDGALEQAAYFSVAADDTENENRVDQSWQAYLGFRGEATLTIHNYSLYTFDSFVK